MRGPICKKHVGIISVLLLPQLLWISPAQGYTEVGEVVEIFQSNTPNLYPLTYANWTAVFENGTEWIVMFYVNEYYPCKYAGRQLESFAKSWAAEHHVSVAVLNIREYQIVEGRFMVIYAPSYFYIKNGEVGEWDRESWPSGQIPSTSRLIKFVEYCRRRGVPEPRSYWLHPERPYMWMIGASFVAYHMLHLEELGDYVMSQAWDYAGLGPWAVIKIVAVLLVLLLLAAIWIVRATVEVGGKASSEQEARDRKRGREVKVD